MEITITITGTCEGGNHVFADVTKDGETYQEVLIRGDLLSAQDDSFLVADERRAIVKEVRRRAKAEGVKTFAALKTFCTDLTITI